MSATTPIKNRQQLHRFRNFYRDVEDKPRNYALIVLGLNSALRISDLLPLRWQDVYDQKKRRYRHHVTVVEQKTGKENTLLLNNSSREALESYRLSLQPFQYNSYIFASQKPPYDPIDRTQAYRIIKRAAYLCGLGDTISCHSLRKTFGYHAWKDGVPPALLMSIYNHSSYSITKRYLGIDQQEKDEVYKNIDL